VAFSERLRPVLAGLDRAQPILARRQRPRAVRRALGRRHAAVLDHGKQDVQIAQPDPPADAAVPIEGLGAHLYAYRKIALLLLARPADPATAPDL
jgi:hypothetical protein